MHARRERSQPSIAASEPLTAADLKAEVRRLWLLPAIQSARQTYQPKAKEPELKVIQRSRFTGVSGTARGSLVTICLPRLQDREAVLETLLHEIVHTVMPDDEVHGSLFCLVLCEAAEQAFGVSIRPDDVPSRGKYHNRAYAIDAAIVERMKA